MTDEAINKGPASGLVKRWALGGDDGHEAVHCPVCGHDYVHIVGHVALVGYEPTRDQSPLGSIRVPDFRGDGIGIRFLGECGHRFTLGMQFHKGQTFAYVTDVATETPMAFDGHSWNTGEGSTP